MTTTASRTSPTLSDLGVDDLDLDAVEASQSARYRRARPAGDHAYRGALLVVALMAAATAATWLASSEAIEGARSTLLWLEAHDTGRGRGLATVIFAAVALLALTVAWARATAPGRPVRLADGRGRMAVDTIARHLEAAMQARPEVRDAAVVVSNRHWRGVRVEARVLVTAQARLDDTIEAFERAAEALLHERVGVPMERRPRVTVDYDELDLRAGRVHG